MTTPMLEAIRDALGTEETGDGLIEVARNAHRAEQKLAAFMAAVERDGNNVAALCSAYAHHLEQMVRYMVEGMPRD